ncbi:MAG TPA: dTDP-4-dehydrorhamnose reductase [Oscillospiraceae bacterium]|nr:dTDP-4-dehydrorhamnose reductase [Oscillospiraceae bacterium]
MKILVTGVNGQLGYDVVKELKRREISCIGTDINDFDITDEEETLDFIQSYSPDAVIHCAAYTAVDKAEDEREKCFSVNVLGTENISKACKRISAKIIYISTDYIFDGKGTEYFETDSPICPINYYGETKYKGEEKVGEYLEKFFIVRISWVFGINGNNFVKTMLKLGKERDEINVVCDQIGSPTYTADLAPLLCDMVVTEKYGVYHATNEGLCSWAEFAEKIFEISGLSVKVNHISSSDYPSKAKRPSNSRLSKTSLESNGFSRLPYWEDAVKRYISSL